MGRHRRVVLAVSVAFAAACNRASEPTRVVGSGAGGGAPSASTPPDRLGEGELPPGVDRAFDLPLPRGSRITQSFNDRMSVSVPLSSEQSANWLRRRHGDLTATIGPAGTLFPHVEPGPTTDGHWVRIEITAGALSTESTWVVDRIAATPPVRELPKTNEEAMRRAGLKPTGELLDPLKQE